MTENVRTYGRSPFRAAVLHGGPGANGDAAPVAKALSSSYGVLEPLQIAGAINGQIEELKAVLDKAARRPVILIGHSWGAWLGFIFSALYPDDVQKLILIGAPPFEPQYASNINKIRLNRLSSSKRAEAGHILQRLTSSGKQVDTHVFARFAELCAEADTFDPVEAPSGQIDYQTGVFYSVWNEAALLRDSGKLLTCAGKIRCPVTAVHGDYDPHPADGVRIPLSKSLKQFRMVLLPDCGHTPWMERRVRETFYRVMHDELAEYSEFRDEY